MPHFNYLMLPKPVPNATVCSDNAQYKKQKRPEKQLQNQRIADTVYHAENRDSGY